MTIEMELGFSSYLEVSYGAPGTDDPLWVDDEEPDDEEEEESDVQP